MAKEPMPLLKGMLPHSQSSTAVKKAGGEGVCKNKPPWQKEPIAIGW
jgi:hypothetical protein